MKDIKECYERLKGIFNITVTPFTPTGEIDFAALSENIERVIAQGYDGLLIGGTYGEFPVMSLAERRALFIYVMDFVKDRVAVMLCSAASDPRDARELTKLAGELGGLPMVTAPFVSEITDEQIVTYFEEMALLSRTGILVYNAPGIGITLTPNLLERLADISGVVGIKQGDLTPTVIDQIANRLAGKLRLFCASDLAFLGPMMAGFDGISTTNSGALPELILATYRALEQGDANTAKALHQLWFEYRTLARQHGQPQLVKAAMALRGFNGGMVRPPLKPISEQALQSLTKVMQQLASDSRTGVKLSFEQPLARNL
ncbi:dihydrodipicolinate synthase family protein [Acinetobacter rathckeae]|uniref:dihydrodipicolinate synthase family protein n=1 Tax=Acinetobacter rathckeae TaxID=2605272 RepID=UPI0018A2D3E8|nr:dihydrodipicolinate synthase family protein [Acinetobacter rathckeae]MBF7695826.1 dihydrodipicolinate synthase family protein [Acinetobacter rathckeae]